MTAAKAMTVRPERIWRALLLASRKVMLWSKLVR